MFGESTFVWHIPKSQVRYVGSARLSTCGSTCRRLWTMAGARKVQKWFQLMIVLRISAIAGFRVSGGMRARFFWRKSARPVSRNARSSSLLYTLVGTQTDRHTRTLSDNQAYIVHPYSRGPRETGWQWWASLWSTTTDSPLSSLQGRTR